MDEYSPDDNLLPYDGTVYYQQAFLASRESDEYFKAFLDTIRWSNDEVKLFGRTYITRRQVAWYGDAGVQYSYSGKSRTAIAWTGALIELKSLVEAASGEQFNSCLLNLYHSGKEGMGWHSDDEKELGKNPTIASVSLGAERRFLFRHRSSKEKISLTLHHGSLLVMKDETQHHWQHQLPKSSVIAEPRINLTFRWIQR